MSAVEMADALGGGLLLSLLVPVLLPWTAVGIWVVSSPDETKRVFWSAVVVFMAANAAVLYWLFGGAAYGQPDVASSDLWRAAFGGAIGTSVWAAAMRTVRKRLTERANELRTMR